MKQRMHDRREFLADVIRQGWKIVSADEGFVELEVANRWQMTGWFIGGRLGMIVLFDAETGATHELIPPCLVPSPLDAEALLDSAT